MLESDFTGSSKIIVIHVHACVALAACQLL